MGINTLIADDSAIVRKIVAKTLNLTGISIDEIYNATNGKEALEIMDDQSVDIVFTDINMPIMGGVEMIDTMNQKGLMENMPVVVISTEGSETRKKQLTEKGVQAYLRKPITPEKLRDIVKDILEI